MPEIVNSMPNPRVSYDWKGWADGNIRKFVKGKDFNCDPKSFRLRAYYNAKRLGRRLTSSVDGNAVYLQFVENGNGSPQIEAAPAKKRGRKKKVATTEVVAQ